jgi:NDP-sugar pyrophosphorylase family protein
VKGFILAAGFGQRMLPITETIPKPLLPVGNLPLIVYALKLLAHHGITDIIINLHYLGKAIREVLGDGSQHGVQITYSEEVEILGTGGGLKRMHSHFDDTVVVVNSDTVLDLDLHAKIAEHRARGALATMVLREDSRREEFGQIEIDAAGRIVRILGQGTVDGPTRSLMFTGVHIVEPRFLEYVPPDVHTCIIRYGYAKALSNNEPLFGTVMDDYWADAGTPERYYQVNEDALLQRMKLRHADPLGGYALSPKRDVADVVRMGNEVDLGAGARILPPVLLGDDTRIGERATVGQGSVIGAKVSIGKDAVVSQSIVLDGARVDAGARVTRTLVGKKASLSLAPAPPDET